MSQASPPVAPVRPTPGKPILSRNDQDAGATENALLLGIDLVGQFATTRYLVTRDPELLRRRINGAAQFETTSGRKNVNWMIRGSVLVLLVIAGGVAANSRLRELAEERCAAAGLTLRAPRPRLCTDNGAMIASFAAHLLAAGAVNFATNEGGVLSLPRLDDVGLNATVLLFSLATTVFCALFVSVQIAAVMPFAVPIAALAIALFGSWSAAAIWSCVLFASTPGSNAAVVANRPLK